MKWGKSDRKTSVAQNYNWRCMECKTCEVCCEKGDDSKIMFCDRCDRGWHLYCLKPALDKPPKGELQARIRGNLSTDLFIHQANGTVRHAERSRITSSRYNQSSRKRDQNPLLTPLLSAHLCLQSLALGKQEQIMAAQHSKEEGTNRLTKDP